MDIAEGLIFAIFWASATVATKFAVHSADPFLLTCIRFLIVGAVLQLYVYGVKRKSGVFPTKPEFKKLLVLGILNITLYMSGFLIAIEYVSAGLISLVTAANPLILIILSAVFLKKRPTTHQWIGIVVCLAGLILAAIPNLQNSHATLPGLAALLLGITALCFGSIYFSKANLSLSKLTVNTWQMTIGGILFIPVILLNGHHTFLIPDLNFFLCLLWLVVPVSIVAYALWLSLMHKDPVKASTWLFLTPVLGYIMAILILRERVTAFGLTGAILVLTGLMYSRRKKSMVPKQVNH